MFKEILNNNQYLHWIADISLVFFFLFFVMIVIMVIFMNKSYLNYMSNLPLENNNLEINNEVQDVK